MTKDWRSQGSKEGALYRRCVRRPVTEGQRVPKPSQALIHTGAPAELQNATPRDLSKQVPYLLHSGSFIQITETQKEVWHTYRQWSEVLRSRGLEVRLIWVQILALPFARCVTLSSWNEQRSIFSVLNGDNSTSHHWAFRMTIWKHTHDTQCLAIVSNPQMVAFP